MNEPKKFGVSAVHLNKPLHRHVAFYVDDKHGRDGGWTISIDPHTWVTTVDKAGTYYGVPSSNVAGYDLSVPEEQKPPGMDKADAWLSSGKADDPKLRERQAQAHTFKSEREVTKLEPAPGQTWEDM